MNDILRLIVENKRREVAALNTRGGNRFTELMPHMFLNPPVSMSRAIKESATGIIAEFKRRSPSKGEIHPLALVNEIVPAYEDAGAAACSVLTDTVYFGGALSDLSLASTLTRLPLLRKDFIIDERQIYEARIFGASAILLIAAVLSFDEIVRFTSLAHSLGMEVLLEIHSVDELDRLSPDVDMIGVNNRDLTSFNTDTATSLDLISSLPAGMVKIAESGISSPAQLRSLRETGYDGFLIGERFMRHDNPGNALKEFINEI